MPQLGETLSPVERKWQLTDADVEQTAQRIVTEAENGVLPPALAVTKIESANEALPHYRPDQLPLEISLSHLRRRVVITQARAHLLVEGLRRGEPGTMHFDTVDAIKRTRTLSNSTTTTEIPFRLTNTLADIRYGDSARRTSILCDIDHRLLNFELDELTESLRTKDWQRIASSPLSVEESLEPVPDMEPNEMHSEATAIFDRANGGDVSPEDYKKLLFESFTLSGRALEEYQKTTDADVVAIAACRFLCAQAQHDLAAIDAFGDEPAGNLSARRVAIELMWQTTDELLQFDAKLDALLDPPRPMNQYSKAELQQLRTNILATEKYRTASRIRAGIEFLRGKYTEEIGRNPNIHYELNPEDTNFVHSFGKRAVKTVVAVPTALQPVQQANAPEQVRA